MWRKSAGKRTRAIPVCPTMSSSLSRRAARVAAVLSPLASLPLILAVPAAQAQAAPAAGPDTVVITATRSAQPLSSVLADVSVVDRAAIERSGASHVADLLARLPGIEFARNGGPGSTTSVFVRGNEARHTALYIDGVRLDSQATGGALWEQIPLDNVERIEVLRGPAAAVYGSDAVAGVVQVFTRRGRSDTRTTAALSAGSHGTVQARAGVSGLVQAADYALSASAGRSDGFDARTAAAAGHNPDDDGWKRESLHARVGLQLHPVHRVEASVLASRMRSGFDGFTPGLDDQNHHSLHTGSLSWQARWSDDASTRLQLGQTLSTYESQPSFYRSETTLRNHVLQHEQRIAGQRVTVTLERREDELLNPATAFTDTLEGRRHQDAVGLGWRGEVGAHGLQLHLRHDDDSEFGGKGTGSAAWGWAVAPQWRVTASAATSFRVPTLFQRFSVYGNPALVPETGRNVELALRWAGAGREFSVTGYRNTVSQLIAFGPPGPCVDAFGCYVNVGRARLEGLTLAGRATLGSVTLHGSLDWHDPRDLDTGLVLARRARQLASLGAQTQLAGWTVGAELQAAGMRYDNASNTQTLGGYGLVNLVVSRVLRPGLTLQARVDNVGDKAYELARTFATAGRQAQLSLQWATP